MISLANLNSYVYEPMHIYQYYDENGEDIRHIEIEHHMHRLEKITKMMREEIYEYHMWNTDRAIRFSMDKVTDYHNYQLERINNLLYEEIQELWIMFGYGEGPRRAYFRNDQSANLQDLDDMFPDGS